MGTKYGKVLTFRAPPHLERKIRELAVDQDRPISNMIRTLVKIGVASMTKGPDWTAIAEACVAKHYAVTAAEVREINEPHKEAIAAAVDAERAESAKRPDWEGRQE